MNSYEQEWLYALLLQLGFVDTEILIFATDADLRPHSYVFARKSGQQA
jgi:hypothetical protein